MAKRCSDCVYCRRDRDRLFREYYCVYTSDVEGKFRSVSPSGCCNNFVERETFENSGYKSGSSCFLTSACVAYMGKADNCEELESLRNFRDSKLKNMDGGATLIQQYYEIAPVILEKIEASPDKASYYDYIYACIKKCLIYIEEKNDAKTLEEYRTMVLTLKSKFSL